MYTVPVPALRYMTGAKWATLLAALARVSDSGYGSVTLIIKIECMEDEI